jgi:hypothetical protein
MHFKSAFDHGAADLYDPIRPRCPRRSANGLIAGSDWILGQGFSRWRRELDRRSCPLPRDNAGVELGSKLARVRLKACPNIAIVNASVEEAVLHAFDCVYVAVVLHWIATATRLVKSHGPLKASGHLTIMLRHHVSNEQGDAFGAATRPIYRRYRPDAVAGAKTCVGPACWGAFAIWSGSPSARGRFRGCWSMRSAKVAVNMAEGCVNP